MSFAASVDTAANTNPEVVRELVRLCLEAKAASVQVLDHAFREGTQPLAYSGILAACNSIAEGCCHNRTRSRYYKSFTLNNAKSMHENAAMIDVLEADVLIACPVAKSHSSTGVSLSLKGQMGLIYDRGCMHGRYDLDTAIVDLAFALKPSLTIIDASRVMSTNGPMGPGKVLQPGEIIASADPVAADAFAVSSYPWYGRTIKPRQVAHIAQAHARGLGRMDIDHLSVQRVLL